MVLDRRTLSHVIGESWPRGLERDVTVYATDYRTASNAGLGAIPYFDFTHFNCLEDNSSASDPVHGVSHYLHA